MGMSMNSARAAVALSLVFASTGAVNAAEKRWIDDVETLAAKGQCTSNLDALQRSLKEQFNIEPTEAQAIYNGYHAVLYAAKDDPKNPHWAVVGVPFNVPRGLKGLQACIAGGPGDEYPDKVTAAPWYKDIFQNAKP